MRWAVFLACVAACAPYEIEDARRNLLQSWGEDVLLPAYGELDARVVELDDAAVALCNAPSSAALEDAQQAWREARAPWKQTEVFAFGPYKEEPLRLGPKIDAWPARPETVDAVLADTMALTADTVEGFGVYAKGFPAIEYLLFQPDIDLVAELGAAPRRCEYLLAMTENLLRKVVELRDAWSPEGADYLVQLTGAGKTSTEFDTLSDALGEVVNRMGFTVENIRVDKIGRPVGVTSGDGSPQPALAESRFSGRSVDDIRDNLRGIEALFFGSDEALGLSFYLQKRGYYFDRAMRDDLDAVFDALDAMDVPLAVAVVEDREPVLASMDPIAALQALLQTEVIPALSLTVGFNDVDGD